MCVSPSSPLPPPTGKTRRTYSSMNSVDSKPAGCAATRPSSSLRAVLSSRASSTGDDVVAAIITVAKRIAPIKPTTRTGAHDRCAVRLPQSRRDTSAILLASELDSNLALLASALASPAARNSAAVLGAEAADRAVAQSDGTVSHAMRKICS